MIETNKQNTMVTENEVFRKIKEISTRTIQPRPSVNTYELANELSMSRENLMSCLTSLKQTRLLNFNDAQAQSVRLTLLGTVVKRDK
jgi:DNA-binding GntR family transcriptional regulator